MSTAVPVPPAVPPINAGQAVSTVVPQGENLNYEQIRHMAAIMRANLDAMLMYPIPPPQATNPAIPVTPPLGNAPPLMTPTAPTLIGAFGDQPRTRFTTLINQPAIATSPDTSVAVDVPKPKEGTGRGSRLRAVMDKAFLDDPISAQADFDAVVEKMSKEATYQANPYTMQHREEMFHAHQDILRKYRADIPEDQYWATDIILKTADTTLVYRIRLTRSQNGGPIQSRTAMAWLCHHTFNICVHTRDPVTKERTGLQVMRTGLYGKMEQKAQWAIHEYQLLRHPGRQQHLDQPCLQLIIEQAIESSEKNGRVAAIQTLLSIGLAFFGAFRSGSLQANHEKYRQDEMYIKLEDCAVEVLRPACWSVTVDVKNWKGYSGPIGKRQVLTFGPVKRAHNLIFEVPLYLVLNLLSRGALKDINTIDELFEYDKQWIVIKDEFKNNPLFLKRTARGLGLIEGVPVGRDGLSATIHHHAVRAGLKGGSIHAIRRGSADKYVLAMGKDKAMLLLNHGDRLGQVLEDHYTSGLQYAPLVEIRLGVLAGNPSEIELETMRRKEQASSAIAVLAMRSRATGTNLIKVAAQSRKRLTKEEDQEIESDPTVEPVLEACKNAWAELTQLFPNSIAPYSRTCKAHIKRLVTEETTATEGTINSRVIEFNKHNDLLIDRRRKALLRLRQARENTERDELDLTVAERDAAREQANKPSALFDEAQAMHLREVARYLKSKERVACGLKISREEAQEMNIPEDIWKAMSAPPNEPAESIPQESEDQDEEEDPEETVVVHDTLLPGQGLPEDSVAPTTAQYTALNASLKTIPNTEVRELESKVGGEETGTNDEEEPDALGVSCDVMRKIYMRYIYAPLQQQDDRASLTCSSCPSFNSRMESNPSGVFSFKTLGEYNKHMRQRHGRWLDLELEMQTEDPKVFVCPGCKVKFATRISCFNHCRKTCKDKDRFIPLYEEFTRLSQNTPAHELARQEKRREDKWVGATVEADSDTIRIARLVLSDLGQYPDFLERWAEGISVHQGEFGGLTSAEVQSIVRDLLEHALSSVPVGQLPEDWDGSVQALKPDFLDNILDDLIRLVQEPEDEFFSDYTESESEEGSMADTL